ncbi:hypothetical protein [Fictibacillus sp. S7]|uniref:hypothetical protein n=1 Tax=Fictibacillus sp. S7 TaxID=2212476 RepID=UPI001012D9EE|nr:hypothetical protein [Fictibacillus sp. S7]RXZ00796.1 hypothetical protein DMO16_14565 [Fictibacillus sp. S7]
MIIETEKYYIPNKRRVILLPIAWREEFNIDVEDHVLIGLNENEIIISPDSVLETEFTKPAKVYKKGELAIPKSIDEQLEQKPHQLLVDPVNKCFYLSPVN